MIQRYVVDPGSVTPVVFPWGKLFWLLNSHMAEDAELTVGICVIDPGNRNGEHLHPNCEEVLFVLEGECDHWLGEERIHLTPGMMIRCPAHMPHCAVNTGDVPFRAFVCFSRPDRHTVLLDEQEH